MTSRRSSSPVGLRYALVTCVAFCALCGPTSAAGPFPLGDLVTERVQGSSHPNFFHSIGGVTVFSAVHPTLGEELWRTDGTAEGTWLLADIYPGGESSFPKGFTRVGDWIYFVASDHSFGRELWRTDGTAEGTELFIDIAPGPTSSTPGFLTALGGDLIFSAWTADLGRELWKVPRIGAPAPLADIFAGLSSSDPENLLAMGSSYIAFSVASSSGVELGVTDGTAAGTVVYDIHTGGSSFAEPLGADSDARLYFEATTPDRGREVWTLEPDTGDLRLISDTMPGAEWSVPLSPLVKDGDLYVTLRTPEGRRLFRSRSGAAVEEISSLSAYGLAEVDRYVFFLVGAGDLFRFDGQSVRRLAAAGVEEVVVDGRSAYLVPHGGEVWFFGDGGLWSSDGTDGGTGLRYAVPWTALGTLQSAGGDLYASLESGGLGIEPWINDGSTFEVLKDLHQVAADSDPREFTVAGDRLYFSAAVDSLGRELLFWDGSGAGAQVVEDLNPGSSGSNPANLVAAGDTLYYSGSTPTFGEELVRLENPAFGATVIDIAPGGEDSSPEPVAPAAGTEVFFFADDSSGVAQVWVTDGAAPLQISAYVGASIHGVQTHRVPALLGGSLYFIADDAITGDELWRSDGAGVELVEDLWPGGFSSAPFDLFAHGGDLYWLASDGVVGLSLWRLDGEMDLMSAVIEGGTPLLGLGPSSLLITRFGDQVGFEPWITDGTPEGTERLADIWAGPGNGLADRLPPFGASNGDYALFSGIEPDVGTELWRTDGTPAGTRRLRDIAPGPVASRPRGFVALPDGDVLFTAYTPSTGLELWRSNGTSMGTYLVADIVPGPGSSEPESLTLFRDWVVFTAHSEGADREPWAYDWTGSPFLFGDDFETGDFSAWSATRP
ncbi:MAG: ELWxxDGT repeat protein [Acidobacteriota bacterium]